MLLKQTSNGGKLGVLTVRDVHMAINIYHKDEILSRGQSDTLD